MSPKPYLLHSTQNTTSRLISLIFGRNLIFFFLGRENSNFLMSFRINKLKNILQFWRENSNISNCKITVKIVNFLDLVNFLKVTKKFTKSGDYCICQN